jgi:hypothetical protein
MSICSEVTPSDGAGNLEVHVAEMILIAENVGEDGEIGRLLDQPHGDAGDRPSQGDAGIHHGERGSAHRCHRGRDRSTR